MVYALALLAAVLAVAAAVASPHGDSILYSDADHRTVRQARVLRAAGLGLSAKPDYVYREHGELLVEEVKSAAIRGAPYAHHVVQLGVELLVVEEAYRRRPVGGRLSYRNCTFTIANSEDLRDQVLSLLRRYRHVSGGTEAAAPTPDAWKCRTCPVQLLCTGRMLPRSAPVAAARTDKLG